MSLGDCGLVRRPRWECAVLGDRALVDAAMIALWRQESAAPEVANERELCRLQERVGFLREPTLSFVRSAAVESRAAARGAATPGQPPAGQPPMVRPPTVNKQSSHFPSSILGASARFHNAWFSIRLIAHRLRRASCHFTC